MFTHIISIYTGENRVNVILSIPQELKQRRDCFDEMNWSAVARKAFEEKIQELEFVKKFKEKSTITEEFLLHQ